MPDHIIDPIPPELLDPNPFLPLSGNHMDDDGQAIDDYFKADPDHGGLPFTGLASESHEYEALKIEPMTRILSRFVQIGTIDGGVTYYDPVQVFPADPNRKHLYIQALNTSYNATSNIRILIGSDKSDLYNGATWTPSSAGGIPSLDDHTGALWVYQNFGTGATYVMAWSITV